MITSIYIYIYIYTYIFIFIYVYLYIYMYIYNATGQQKVTLSNDIIITKSHLEIGSMQMRYHYQIYVGNER